MLKSSKLIVENSRIRRPDEVDDKDISKILFMMKFVNKTRRQSITESKSSITKITKNEKASARVFNSFLNKLKTKNKSKTENYTGLAKNFSEVWKTNEKYIDFKPVREISHTRLSSSERINLKIKPIITCQSERDYACNSDIKS